MKLNRKKVFIGSTAIGVVGILSTALGLSGTSTSIEATGLDENLNKLISGIKLNFKEQQKRQQLNVAPSDITENDLTLSYNDDVKAFAKETIFLEKYKVSVRTVNGKMFVANDLTSSIEVVLVIENLVDTRNKKEVIKTLNGFKVFDQQLIVSELNKPAKFVVRKNVRIDFFELEKAINKTTKEGKQRYHALKKYFDIVVPLDEAYLADVELIDQTLTYTLKKEVLKLAENSTNITTEVYNGVKQTINLESTNEINNFQNASSNASAPIVSQVDEAEHKLLTEAYKMMTFDLRSDSELRKLLPSQISDQQLNADDIVIRRNGFVYDLPANLNLKYKFRVSNSKNDFEGSGVILATLSSKNAAITKEIFIANFANRLDFIADNQISAKLVPALTGTNILPSKLLDKNGKLNPEKVTLTIDPAALSPSEAQNYSPIYIVEQLDDATGKFIFSARLYLNENLAITKTFGGLFVPGLQNQSDYDAAILQKIKDELAKITALELKPSSSLANKMPSAVKNVDLNNKNLDVKAGVVSYALPDGAVITYSLADTNPTNDVDGKIKVKVEITIDGKTLSKEIEVEGLTTKLDKVTDKDVSISLTLGTKKDTTKASDLLNSDGTVDTSKITVVVDGKKLTPEEVAANYDVTIKPTYINDVDGTVGLNVTLTSKTDPKETKTFEDIEITGLKPNTLENELSNTTIKLKDDLKDKTTVEDVKNAINSASTPEEKLEKLKEYFDITLAPDTEIKDISNVALKPGTINEAEITFTIVKPNVPVGTKEEKTATKDVTSLPTTVDVGNFANANELLAKELDKITSIGFNPTKEAELATLYPYQFDDDKYNKDNLQLKSESEAFAPSNGIKVTIEKPTGPSVNNLDGTVKVIVKVEKNGEVLTKEMTVPGFKTLGQDDLNLTLAPGTDASNLLPSNLMDGVNVDVTKVVASVKPTSAFNNEELSNQYDITYEKVETNDDKGIAKFNVVLTSKEDPTITKTFPNFEITGLQKELETLNTNDLDLTTIASAPKNETLASNLLISEGEVDPTKLVLAANGAHLNTADLDKYNVTYEKVYLNDVTGEAVFNVILALKEDPTITKKLDNIKITGLKSYTIDETLQTGDFTLKSEKSGTTIADLKTELDKLAGQAKVNKFKEYFDITIPAGLNLASVENFVSQDGSKTTANLTYTLSKDNVAAGTADNKNATQTVTSDPKTVAVNGFTSENTLITKELEKITNLDLATDSPLGDKLPSEVTTTDLVDAAFNPKAEGNKPYNKPDSFDVTYTVSSDADAINDVDGTIKIVVTIDKNGETDSKTIIVPGLKTKLDKISASDLQAEITDKTTTLASAFDPATAAEKLSLSTTSTDLTTADLEKYNVTYEKLWANDLTGEVGLKVVLTSKTDPTKTKEFPNVVINGFKVLSVDEELTTSSFTLKSEKSGTTIEEIKNQLAKITDESAKVAKLKEYFDITMPSADIELSSISNFEAVSGSTTQATLTYKLTKTGVANGSASAPNATTSVVSSDKTVAIDGLTNASTLATAQLEKITNLSLTEESALKDKLPSTITTTDLSTSNLTTSGPSGTYTTPEGYTVTYAPSTATDAINDVDGTLKITVTVTKDGVSETKDITLTGLKTKLDTVDKSDLSVSVENANSTVPSTLNVTTDANKLSLASTASSLTTADLEKYNVTYEKLWANDVEGKVGFNVTLTSKTDPKETKKFTGIETSGLQIPVTTGVLSAISLKEAIAPNTTVEDAKIAINSAGDQAAQVAKFQELFNVTVPEGMIIKEVSLAQKPGSTNEAVLTYKLAKTGVAQGTETNPSATGQIVGPEQTIAIQNFAEADALLSKEIAKVTALSFTTAKSPDLAAKYAYQFVDSDFTAVNIQTKNGETNYKTPEGYTLTFSRPTTNPTVNNFDGSLKVTVQISKESKSITKELTLSGFKTLTKADFGISLVDPTSASATTPKSLMSGETVDTTKVKATVASSSAFDSTKLNEQFNISYTATELNVQTGKASFNVILTSKTESTISQTFGTYEITDLQKEIDTLNASDLTLSTTENKTEVIPSTLLKADGTVDITKVVLNAAGLDANLNEKYDATYSKNYVNDITGKASFDVVVTLKSDPSIKKSFTNVEISGLKTHLVADLALDSINLKSGVEKTLADIKSELDKITDKTAKITKFEQYFTTTLPSNIALAEITSLEAIEGQPTKATLTYKLTESNVAAGTNDDKSKVGSVTSTNKTLVVSGFTNPKTLTDKELVKITALNLTTDSALKAKLPSEAQLSDLTLSNLTSGYSVPEGYKVTYAFPAPKKPNDITGDLDVTILITKDEITSSKTLTVAGLKTKLDNLTKEQFTLDYTGKETILPSAVNTSDETKFSPSSTQLGDMSPYTVTYTKTWTNDVTGQAGFDVTIALTANPAKTKTFTDVAIDGFKTFNVTENLTTGAIVLKDAHRTKSVADIKAVLGSLSGQEKVNKFNEFFTTTLPENHNLKEIVSIIQKTDDPTQADVVYKLEKTNVPAGTQSSKTATATVVGTDQTILVSNFSNQDNLSNAEIAKIASLELTDSSELKNLFPSLVTGGKLTLTNLVPKKTDGSKYEAPEGYSLTFTLSTPTNAIDLEGKLSITATLTKDEVVKNKTFVVTGLKKLAATDLTLGLVSSIVAANTKPSDLLDADGTKGNVGKLNTGIAAGSTYTVEKLSEKYTIAYEKVETNDKTGKAKFSIILTDKNDNTKTAKFTADNFTIPNLQKHLDLVTAATLTLTTKADKTTILPSGLINSDNSGKTDQLSLTNSSAGLDLTDYKITYQKAWINDKDGTVGFNITLTLNSDTTVTKTINNVSITDLKQFAVDQSLTTANFTFKAGKATTTVTELKDALTKATTFAQKLAKLNEIFNIAVPAGHTISEIGSFEPKTGSTTAGNLTYKLSKAGISAGSQTNPEATANVVSTSKTVEIINFTGSETLIDQELGKIDGIATIGAVLPAKLPTAITTAELITTNITAKAGKNNYETPEGYQVTYALAEVPKANDVDGTLLVKVTITKDGISKSKNLTLKELQNELTSLTKEQLTINHSSKNATLPSAVDFASTTKTLSLATSSTVLTTTELSAYDVTFTKKWVDDVTGKIGADVTITSKTDNTKTKTFTDVEVTDFKTTTAPTSVEANAFSLKSTKANTTVVEIKTLLEAQTSQETKIAKFKEYFDITLPTNINLKEIISFNPDPENPQKAILKFKLENTNVANGSLANKSQTTTLVSNELTTTLSGFGDQNALSDAELAKIQSIELTSSSALASKYAFEAVQDLLTKTNIQAKGVGGTLYAPADGYDLSYTLGDTNKINDLAATIEVIVNLTKNGVTKTKTLTLSGLKTLAKDALTLSLATGIVAANTSPSELLKADGTADSTKLATKVTSSLGFSEAQLAKYTITYTKKTIDEQKGNAIFDIVLTSKTTPSFTKTFSNYQITGLRKAIEKLVATDLTLELANKATILPSTLFDNEGNLTQTLTATVNATKMSSSDFADYTLTYAKSWVNDITGVVGIDVTLTHNTDKSINFTIPGVSITGMKIASIDSGLKPSETTLKKAMSVEEFKNGVMSQSTSATKATKLMGYLNTTLPTGTTISAVSSIEPKDATATTAVIQYTLTKAGIANGNADSKDATGTITGTFTLELSGFTSQSALLTKELAKIDAIELTSSSELKSVLPSKTTTENLITTNIQAKSGSAVYTVPTGYTLSYEPSTAGSKNNLDGSVQVMVKLTKNGISEIKQMNLSGLKKIMSTDLSLDVAATVAKTSTLASELLSSSNPDATKLKTSLSAATTIEQADLDKYTITYENPAINDALATATFDVKLTSKTNNTHTTKFTYTVSGLQKELDRVQKTDLAFDSASSINKVNTTPNDLFDTSGNVVPSNLSLSSATSSWFTATKLAGYNVTYTKISTDELYGKAKFNVTLTHPSDTSVTKTFDDMTISGLKDMQARTFTLSLASGVTKNQTMPTSLMNGDEVNDSKLSLQLVTGSSFNAGELAKYNVSYTKKVLDDQKGRAIFDITLTSKTEPTITKKIENVRIDGLRRLIDNLVNTDLTISLENKANTLPTWVLSASNPNPKTPVATLNNADKISQAEFALYNVSFARAYANDIDGNMGLNVTLVLKSEPAISATIRNVPLDGLRKIILEPMTLASSGINKTASLEEFKTDVMSPTTGTAKVAKLKEYIGFTVVRGSTVIDILSIEPKDDTATVAVVTYKISRGNMAYGTATEPNRITVTSSTLTIEINGFTSQATLLAKELEKITALELTESSALKNTYPSNTNNAALTTTNVQSKNNADVYNVPEGYTLSYETPTKNGKINNLDGSMDVVVKLTKKSISATKTLPLSGLKQIVESDLKLATVASVNKATTLPTELYSGSNLNQTKLTTSPSSSATFDATELSKYTISYATNNANNQLGILSANVNLTLKSDPTKSKTFTLTIEELQKELERATNADFILDPGDGITRATTAPSDFFDATNNVISNKLKLQAPSTNFNATQLEAYDQQLSHAWINEVDGTIGINLKLSLKSKSAVTKMFKGLILDGLKKHVVTEELDTSKFKIKEAKKDTTIVDLKTAIAAVDTQTAKVAKFLEYFNVTLPTNVTLNSIDEIGDGATLEQANLKYTLVKSGIKKGTLENPNATGSVISTQRTTTIGGLGDPAVLITAELEKITALELTSSSGLKSQLPSTTTNTDYTIENILAKAGSTNYALPTGYSMRYEVVAGSTSKNDLDGSIKMNIIITKDGVSKSKQFILFGLKNKLKTIKNNQFSLEVDPDKNDNALGGVTLPSTLINADGSVKDKLELHISGFDDEDLKAFNITYTKKWINDVDGQAGFDIKLQSKTIPSLEATFTNVAIERMKKYDFKNTLTETNFTFKEKNPDKKATVKSLSNALRVETEEAKKEEKLKQVFDINLPANNLFVEIIGLEQGSTETEGVLVYRLSKSQVPAGSETDTSKVKTIESGELRTTIPNFRAPLPLDTEIEKITKIEIISGSALASKSLSKVIGGDLIKENIQPKVAEGTNYNLEPSLGYDIFYKLADIEKDTHAGTVAVEVILYNLSNPRENESKVILMGGFTKKLNEVVDNQFSVTSGIVDKTLYNASYLLDDKNDKLGNPRMFVPKITGWTTTDLDKYNYKYDITSLDDIKGELYFDVTMTLKSDPSVTRKFTRNYLNGYKPYTMPTHVSPSDVYWHPNYFNKITYSRMQRMISSKTTQYEKDQAVLKLIRFELPRNVVPTSISFSIAAGGEGYTITFSLVNNKVYNGSPSEPNKVSSMSTSHFNLEFSGFARPEPGDSSVIANDTLEDLSEIYGPAWF